ncbi:MAG TPA: histidine phosphatase family protein [Rhabdochlamydiaceae bacterium]|nr:histidine phosphatase family protein [Rhabdochlamydiaceae bacterium]
MKQKIYLIRHGETEWTLSDQHTGLTDIPLTPQGESEAKTLKERLKGHAFKQVLVSPLQRAKKTCALAGFLDQAELDRDLVEWNYGKYEGKKNSDIFKENPSWEIFKNGAPGGESVAEIEKRALRVLKKIKEVEGDVAVFSHGHFLRVLTACYLQLTAAEGRLFFLSTASISILGYERENPVIILWNSHS